jgi:small-conductance mechanosensitive channel
MGWGDVAWTRWLIALWTAAVLFLILFLVRRVFSQRARVLGERRLATWFGLAADLIEQTRSWFLVVVAVYGASLSLPLSGRAAKIINTVTILAWLVQGGLWASTLVASWVRRYVAARREVDASSVTTITALGYAASVVIWSTVLLAALANMGVNITAMIAGLGIGGIAVALAAQNILSDLFASASIVLDKPFVLGDFIIVGSEMGSVEKIGLKTTRLRSLSGEQIIFSNDDLLKSRIRNCKRMQERRNVFTIGVVYDTTYDKLAAIPAILREAVESQSQTRFDRAHFKQYGDFALIFEVVYYVVSPDHNLYMDIQQAVNLHIFRRFEAEQIQFAFPTQTIYLQQSSTITPGGSEEHRKEEAAHSATPT